MILKLSVWNVHYIDRFNKWPCIKILSLCSFILSFSKTAADRIPFFMPNLGTSRNCEWSRSQLKRKNRKPTKNNVQYHPLCITFFCLPDLANRKPHFYAMQIKIFDFSCFSPNKSHINLSCWLLKRQKSSICIVYSNCITAKTRPSELMTFQLNRIICLCLTKKNKRKIAPSSANHLHSCINSKAHLSKHFSHFLTISFRWQRRFDGQQKKIRIITTQRPDIKIVFGYSSGTDSYYNKIHLSSRLAWSAHR